VGNPPSLQRRHLATQARRALFHQRRAIALKPPSGTVTTGGIEPEGAIKMMPTQQNAKIGKRTCDSLRLHAGTIAAKLQKEMKNVVLGRRDNGIGDLSRLAALCCGLSQLGSVVRKAIAFAAPPVPEDLVALSRLIGDAVGPAMDYAAFALEPGKEAPGEIAARASMSIERLLAFAGPS
jgi:hypothetical protein